MMDIKLLGVVLIFLSVNIQTSESCRCFPFHPQYHFCNSEIVILADITRGILNSRYKIQVIKVFKGPFNTKRIQYVSTLAGTSCGITLDKGRYVLSGNKAKDGLELGMCNLVRRWDDLSSTEKKNLVQTYTKIRCTCTVTSCFDSPCCPNSNKECMWKDLPYPLEYACLEDNNGTCSWYRDGIKAPADPLCEP